MRTKLSQAVRWAWILTGAVLLVLLTIWGDEAVPMVGLTLVSFPASFLAGPIANFILDFPVRIEGLPFPPSWWIYGLLTLVLGYVQWFVLPRLVTKIIMWRRKTRLH